MWVSEEERRYHASQERNWLRAKAARKHRKRKKGRLHRKKELKRERLSAHARCEKYLKEFWPKFEVARGKQERMNLLKAAIKLNWWVSDNLRERLRKEYLRIRRVLLTIPSVECGICESAPAVEKHHIVMIAYGGYNMDDNLLKICFGCHEEIHPWLRR